MARKLFSFVDTTNAAVFSATDQIIRFFQDDNATSQNEAESGFVDRIRLFDAALESNDQRGAMFNRVVGSAIDIGAYEAQSTPSADFDSDGDIDGTDFLSWQRGFGKANAVRADGNSDDDTDVDASDLAAWATTFGSLNESPLLVATIDNNPPAATPPSLIDVAMALVPSSNKSNEESSFVTELAAIELLSTTHRNTAQPTIAMIAENEVDPLSQNPKEAEEHDQPWLADELLERVFG